MTDELERGSSGTGAIRPTARPDMQPTGRPSAAQGAYLRRGLAEPGGKLPLFDRDGQRYPNRTIESCIAQGWAEPWFRNPIKPDWLICKLTEAGRAAAEEAEEAARPLRPAPPPPRRDARSLQLMVRELA